ncbi:hypothetical protein WA026_018351, partial [Henosepilachna vigintioctopunctata]
MLLNQEGGLRQSLPNCVPTCINSSGIYEISQQTCSLCNFHATLCTFPNCVDTESKLCNSQWAQRGMMKATFDTE